MRRVSGRGLTMPENKAGPPATYLPSSSRQPLYETQSDFYDLALPLQFLIATEYTLSSSTLFPPSILPLVGKSPSSVDTWLSLPPTSGLTSTPHLHNQKTQTTVEISRKSGPRVAQASSADYSVHCIGVSGAMVQYAANPPPRAATSPPTRRSAASPERRSQILGDPQYPPGFDLNGFEDIILPPASALTSRTASYPTQPELESDEDDDIGAPSPNNTFLERCKNTALSIPTTSAVLTQNPRTALQARAKSIASLVPNWSNTRQEAQSQIPHTHTEAKLQRKPTFVDLFAGSSAPVNIGVIPSPDKEKTSLDWDNNDHMSRPTNKRTSTGMSSASSSRFSWFGGKVFHPAPTPISERRPQSASSDALLDLNIDACLFPHGPVDRFDPASFNDLLRNAQTTIAKLQTGYRQKRGEAETARAEASAQTDEAEEAETRARHLKQQLDDMASRVAEQDTAMKALADQLAQERLIRREEEEARKRSVMLVRSKSQQSDALDRETADTMPSGNKRESGGTSLCDSGFESDAESSVESVFSRPATNDLGSPLMASTPLSTLNEWVSDDGEPATVENATKLRLISVPSHKTSMGPRNAGLGVTGKRKSGVSLEDYMERRLSSPATQTCSNCHAGSQTNAWSLVSELRMENKGLNSRVADLERTVEGCLDLVAGLH